jgi:hypothetical protein
MKRFALVTASLMLTFTGCGRGWLPFCNRGGSCVASRCMNATQAPIDYAQGTEVASGDGDCIGCENVGVGYGDYPQMSSDGYTHTTLPNMQNVLPQESVIGQPIK